MSVIDARELTKTFGAGESLVAAVSGVSLSVGAGEIVLLLGPSGSGKTTLVSMLGGLLTPTHGTVEIEGVGPLYRSRDLAGMRLRSIGFVFQSFNLLARTSALENVVMPLSYTATDLSEREGRKRGRAMLELVGLGDRMHHEPSQLSGGQQQRVAIARALVNHPPLLLADEPTGNLDSRTSEEILRMFQQLNAEEGITIILVTHDAGVASHAKRVIHIRDGLIEHGAFGAEAKPNGQPHAEAVSALPATAH